MLESFGKYVQMLSYEIATIIKSTLLVSYPLHVVLVNFSIEFRRWLFENKHTIVALLSVVGAGGGVI